MFISFDESFGTAKVQKRGHSFSFSAKFDDLHVGLGLS